MYDIDFVLCPRCASTVESERATDGSCYLCLQEPQATLSREDLIREQGRIAAQLTETDELVAARQEAAAGLEAEVARLTLDRDHASAALDQEVRAFVSDEAEEITRRTRERAEAQAASDRAREYLELFERLDASLAEEGQLQQRKDALEAEAEQAQSTAADSGERISHLEEHFARLVEDFGTPRFEGEPRAAIDRRSYLPIINGRSFEQLSSGGLKVLANLAYALAHHLTALDLGIPLPGLLLIDGITKNVGRDDYDQARVDAVFDTLRRISHEHGERLQIIVAANDVPDSAVGNVALPLSPHDRLIPLSPS